MQILSESHGYTNQGKSHGAETSQLAEVRKLTRKVTGGEIDQRQTAATARSKREEEERKNATVFTAT